MTSQSSNGTIIEWLVNLDQLLGKGEFWFAGYPLMWLGETGSPVRAIAKT